MTLVENDKRPTEVSKSGFDLPESISKSIITTYSRLDCHLQLHGDFIVDGYLVGPANLALILPQEEKEALDEFKGNMAALEAIGLERLTPEGLFIYSNLLATTVFREEQERIEKGEERMNYVEYLRKVSGIEPKLIEWQSLEADREEIVQALRSKGLDFNEEKLTSFAVALYAYQTLRRYTNPHEITERFKYYDDGYRFVLGNVLGKDLRSVESKVIWVEANAFWKMYERMTLLGNILYANWHERQRSSWDEGIIEMYAVHEPTHFIWGHLIREEIIKGNLDPAAGILPIPGPACYQAEGIAQTVSLFVPAHLGFDGQLALNLYTLEKRALANGLYLLETDSSMSVDKVARFIRRYMPHKNPREIRQLLTEGTTQPFERAYLPIYGLSYDYFTNFRKKANPKQRAEFLKIVFSRPMTPDQLHKEADRILQKAA